MKLACHDSRFTLDSLIDLAIHLDRLLQSRHPAHSEGALTAPYITAETMQQGHLRHNEEERETPLKVSLLLQLTRPPSHPAVPYHVSSGHWGERGLQNPLPKGESIPVSLSSSLCFTSHSTMLMDNICPHSINQFRNGRKLHRPRYSEPAQRPCPTLTPTMQNPSN